MGIIVRFSLVTSVILFVLYLILFHIKADKDDTLILLFLIFIVYLFYIDLIVGRKKTVKRFNEYLALLDRELEKCQKESGILKAMVKDQINISHFKKKRKVKKYLLLDKKKR